MYCCRRRRVLFFFLCFSVLIYSCNDAPILSNTVQIAIVKKLRLSLQYFLIVVKSIITIMISYHIISHIRMLPEILKSFVAFHSLFVGTWLLPPWSSQWSSPSPTCSSVTPSQANGMFLSPKHWMHKFLASHLCIIIQQYVPSKFYFIKGKLECAKVVWTYQHLLQDVRWNDQTVFTCLV